jgi:hypothetical protein
LSVVDDLLELTTSPQALDDLVSGGDLFTALKERPELRNSKIADRLSDALDWAVRNYDPAREKLAREVESVAGLLIKCWLAAPAGGGPPPAPCSRFDSAWISMCIHAFGAGPFREVTVPAAFWRDERGVMGKLVVTTYGNVSERGPVAHPADAFRKREVDFLESIRGAWNAALRHARVRADAHGTAPVAAAHWRIEHWKDEPPIKETVSGPSAGGAAAVAFFHAMLGTYPDERVIVLAGMQPGGGSHKVDGIREKIAEIQRLGHWDTVVVMDEENRAEAVRALGASNGSIRIVLGH